MNGYFTRLCLQGKFRVSYHNVSRYNVTKLSRSPPYPMGFTQHYWMCSTQKSAQWVNSGITLLGQNQVQMHCAELCEGSGEETDLGSNLHSEITATSTRVVNLIMFTYTKNSSKRHTLHFAIYSQSICLIICDFRLFATGWNLPA
jgi:hypothetical protein